MYQRAGYLPPQGLPLTEVLVTRLLPAMLTSVPKVGAHLSAGAPIATLGRGRVVVAIALDSSAFVRLQPEMTASVRISGASSDLPATVVSLAERGRSGEPTVILACSSVIRSSLVGRAAVGIVTIRVVAHDALLVPARAVATTAGGVQQVLAKRGAANPRAVEVTLLGSIAGRSAVDPTTPGSLRVGDLVQVG
jgi:hypothetical protein